MKILIFPNDPLISYVKKGELKKRYFNPNNIFKRIYFITFTHSECKADEIKEMTGCAEVKIFNFSPLGISDIFFPHKRALQIYEKIKELDIDVIRAYNPTLIGYIALLVAKKIKKPLIVSIHTIFSRLRRDIKSFRDIFRVIKYHLLYPKELSVYKNANFIIGITDKTIKHIKNKNKKVIFNRIYRDAFYEIALKKEYDVITVGRIESPKRQDLLLKAIDKKTRVLLIGSGSNLNKLKIYAKKNNLDVTFIESVSNKELVKYYNKAKICVQISDYEGFGIPLVEAMMLGLPLVCSNIDTFQEVTNGNALFAKNDYKDIKEKIYSLLNDKNKLYKLKTKSQKRAQEINANIIEKKEE